MRAVSAFALAFGLLSSVAGVVAPAQDKKAEQQVAKKGEKEKPKPPDRPPLDAKEWTKLKSGVEIWDVKEGEGKEAKANSTVVVHYTGWLTDEKATVFDSSIPRGKPNTFTLYQLAVKGWADGIAGMKPGGVRRLKIPPERAYGKEGSRGVIPPDATLIFEIELIKSN